MKAKKYFYVPWEGYQPGDRQTRGFEDVHPLDVLCLQGPHTREKALQIRDEILAAGCRATVIDASEDLKKVEAFPALYNAVRTLLELPGEELLSIRSDILQKLRTALAEAEDTWSDK